MPRTEHPLQALAEYLPEGTFDLIAPILMEHRVHLTVTQQRKTILGDYRNAAIGKNHRISVNGNLNPYAFLITLLHELVHLFTYEKYGHRVNAHGMEWKKEYSAILALFTQAIKLPDDLSNALNFSIQNPAASSCREDALQRVLKKYDQQDSNVQFVESLQQGDFFQMQDGRVFQRGKKLRKRYQCIAIQTGLLYLFSPVCEVTQLKKPEKNI
jgi:hypothetical protein